jgi:hypothetical protein
MLVLILFATAGTDPFASARNDIDVFCHGASTCIERQRSEMGHFVTMMAAFKDPGLRTAKRCMSSGKKGPYVDWTIATPCMRRAVKGQRVGD